MQYLTPIAPNTALAFTTPILVRRMPAFEPVNRGLGAQIRAAMQRDGGVQISNVGGWQSRPDFWSWESEEAAIWRGWVHGAILRMAALLTEETDLANVDVTYRAGAWVNVNRNGQYNDGHIHPDCDWAVVYYVETGTPDPGWPRNGKIELHDPRTLAFASSLSAFGFARSLLIDPEPGKLVMFPSWIEHSVHPFYGTGERISIACNVKITGGRHSGFA
jgi:uncharacterized protein (TIGR02466 family)